MGILAQENLRSELVRHSVKRLHKAEEIKDTVDARFSVSETAPQDVNDLQQRPLDLKNPENIVTDTIYNDKDSTYTIATRLKDGALLGTPLLLSPEEYAKWNERKSMQSFFRKKNYEDWENSSKKGKFDFTDMHFDLGPAEKIFGPGGVRIKTQGNA
jgi:hypothetical protein